MSDVNDEEADAEGADAIEDDAQMLEVDQVHQDGDNLENNRGQLLREVTVPTKTRDGGGAAELSTENGAANEEPARPDAFARYSNQNVRMTHLLGLDNGNAQAENDVTWRAITGYQCLRRLRQGVEVDENERRTRLPTELYPDTFYNIPPQNGAQQEEGE